VHVKNTSGYRSDCQNTADLPLAKSLPMALKSRLFLPLSLSHLNPETPQECEYEGRFFRGGLKKQGFSQE
jgi:hypothetical protein